MTTDQGALIALGIFAVFLAVLIARMVADARQSRRDMERLRKVDREWAAAFARWLSSGRDRRG